MQRALKNCSRNKPGGKSRSLPGFADLPCGRTLLHQVFANLLSNALKYTRQRAEAKIEIGWDDSHEAYFVRDNGAGFDMQYAGKSSGVSTVAPGG